MPLAESVFRVVRSDRRSLELLEPGFYGSPECFYRWPTPPNRDKRQTLNITKQRLFFKSVSVGPERATQKGMNFYNRLIAMHSESRPMFILFTECMAFTGSMAAIVGIGFIREWLL